MQVLFKVLSGVLEHIPRQRGINFITITIVSLIYYFFCNPTVMFVAAVFKGTFFGIAFCCCCSWKLRL